MSLLLLAQGLAEAQLKMVEAVVPGTTRKWIKVYQEEVSPDLLLQETLYHANENPWMMVKYDQQTGTERWQWFYENENPLWSATIVDGLLQGRYQHWYENGMVAEILYFSDNVENGPASFYYRSGQLAMEGRYDNGVMVDFNFYDQMGEPFTGTWEWFLFPTHTLRMTGSVVGGKMEGEWLFGQTANVGKPNRVTYTIEYRQGTPTTAVN